jgi:hypothetical protein
MSTDPETPKRLTPVPEVLRELYLRSGNLCAFPHCSHRIIDDNGRYVAELCHIEAALPEGERFNKHSDNEKRRLLGNLMLMCHAHHVVTDDVNEYPVARMVALKREHEAKFSGVPEKIQAAFADQTKAHPPIPARSLDRLAKSMRWDASSDQVSEARAEFDDFVKSLAKVPRASRELLVVIVERAEEGSQANLYVPFADIVHAVQREKHEVREQVQLLEHHGMVWVDSGYDDIPMVITYGLKSGWPIWSELRGFCLKAGVELRSLVVDLRFDQLD